MPYCLVCKACKANLKYEAVLETQPFGGSKFEQCTVQNRLQSMYTSNQVLAGSSNIVWNPFFLYFCNFTKLTIENSKIKPLLDRCVIFWHPYLPVFAFKQVQLSLSLRCDKKCAAYLNNYTPPPSCDSWLLTSPSSEAIQVAVNTLASQHGQTTHCMNYSNIFGAYSHFKGVVSIVNKVLVWLSQHLKHLTSLPPQPLMLE